MTISGSELLALWGAGLSTILAVVKLSEVWRDRFRLETSYRFYADAEEGNKIMIRNLSGRPITIEYWELLYRGGSRFRAKLETFQCADHDDDEIRIEPHTTCTLTFAGADHFDWSHKVLNGRSIWIRLHIAGRGTVLRRVYR